MKRSFTLQVLLTLAFSIGYWQANAQLKIGSDPTLIGPGINLEVQGSAAGKPKFSIDQVSGDVKVKGSGFAVEPATGTAGFSVNSAGQVTIKGGAADKSVLTSDAAGNATWKPLPEIQKFVRVAATTQEAPGVVFGLPLPGMPVNRIPLRMSQNFIPKTAADTFIVDAIIHYNVNNIEGKRIGFAIEIELNGQKVGEQFIRNDDISGGCYGNYLLIKSIIPTELYQLNSTNKIELFVVSKRNDNSQITNVGFGASTAVPSSPCGGAASYLSNKLIITSYQ